VDEDGGERARGGELVAAAGARARWPAVPSAETLEPKTDLNQLVIFAKVVETGSFTAAGRQLGLPKSTVSRKIAQLEERFGVQLLVRTTRKLAMTDVGAAFYERCSRISAQVDEVERAFDDLRAEPSGLLRVAVSHELASIVSSDLIGEFLLAHARIDVELELTGRTVDAIEQGFDLVLDQEAVKTSGLLAVELGSVERRLVASPTYLERRGTPKTPTQLERHDLCVGRARATSSLSHAARASRTAQDCAPSFELFGPHRASVVISNRPRLSINDDVQLREAALAGVGIALLPVLACRRELDAGLLCMVLEDWAPSVTRVHAVYPSAHHFAAKLHAFVEFMRERLEPWGVEVDADAVCAPRLQADAQPSA
jgi:DNA-binding transcriptional LysR family regulator